MSLVEPEDGGNKQPFLAADAARSCPSWGQMTPADLLTKQASQNPDVAFLTLSSGQTISYWQAEQIVSRLAAFFTTTNLKLGDCVLLRQGRRHEGLFAFLGLLRAGLDVCLVPQTMSARDICQGARALLPKGVVDVEELGCGADPTSSRLMEVAAGLFTVRFAGGFGELADGVSDLSDEAILSYFDGNAPHLEPRSRLASDPAHVHVLRLGPSGRVDRLSRTAGGVLTQGLAAALELKLSSRSVVGLPFDPISPTGLFCAVVPSLLVGARLELFDALDPLVADHLTYWSYQSEGRVSLLPFALFHNRKEVADGGMVGRQAWICTAGQSANARGALKRDRFIVDLAGFAFLPGLCDHRDAVGIASGNIQIAGSKGPSLVFGDLSLKGPSNPGPDHGSGHEIEARSTSGEILVSGPIAASAESSGRRVQFTGVWAQSAERNAPDETASAGATLLCLQEGETGVGPHVGGQPVMMAAVNRSLSLTGRWEDAAAFTVPDPILGNRIEVAIEPRVLDAEDAGADSLPSLETVRKMLSDSGLSDGALPVRLHLVTAIPRSASGQVLASELKPFPIEAEQRADAGFDEAKDPAPGDPAPGDQPGQVVEPDLAETAVA